MSQNKMEQNRSESNNESETIAPSEITADNSHITTPTVPSIVFVPTSSSSDDIPPPKADFYAPPPYEVATKTTKLPTYEEVQREKNLEEQNVPINTLPPTRLSQYRAPGQRILTIENESNEEVDTSLLGTDFMFYIAFFVAFIFNWIGFLLLMCFCHTIASRYGALSGFGLSLAKWTFIVQHSTDLASKDNSWLWWLIMTFGLIICIRAILQYLSIKRGWHMLSASHQERLLFFY
ncbi:NEDD4 family-interacting protein 1 [Tribolium madens]|uniref:NEDD4 family-interacting protein 1 n=1 Tax=Tribolium madens TaxID=41895 RepID=UPI001CF72021|nr:NEDD4 family-interacting protein 1 [Tribolium madens]